MTTANEQACGLCGAFMAPGYIGTDAEFGNVHTPICTDAIARLREERDRPAAQTGAPSPVGRERERIVDEITQVAFSAYAMGAALNEPDDAILSMRRIARECAERLATLREATPAAQTVAPSPVEREKRAHEAGFLAGFLASRTHANTPADRLTSIIAQRFAEYERSALRSAPVATAPVDREREDLHAEIVRQRVERFAKDGWSIKPKEVLALIAEMEQAAVDAVRAIEYEATAHYCSGKGGKHMERALEDVMATCVIQLNRLRVRALAGEAAAPRQGE